MNSIRVGQGWILEVLVRKKLLLVPQVQIFTVMSSDSLLMTNCQTFSSDKIKTSDFISQTTAMPSRITKRFFFPRGNSVGNSGAQISPAMIWQMAYTQKLPKLCSATLKGLFWHGSLHHSQGCLFLSLTCCVKTGLVRLTWNWGLKCLYTCFLLQKKNVCNNQCFEYKK